MSILNAMIAFEMLNFGQKFNQCWAPKVLIIKPNWCRYNCRSHTIWKRLFLVKTFKFTERFKYLLVVYCKCLRHQSILKDKQIPMTLHTRSYHPKSRRNLDNASKPWWYLFPTKLWYFVRAVKIGFKMPRKMVSIWQAVGYYILDQERFWSLNKAFIHNTDVQLDRYFFLT